MHTKSVRWTSSSKFDGKDQEGRATTVYTILIAPRIQAHSHSPECATEMMYRCKRTEEILAQLLGNNGLVSTYDDLFHGSEYLEACIWGDIKPDDTFIIRSIERAQLYQHKPSDCWIYIRILTELGPHLCYKRIHVLPGGFIPGSNNRKLIEFFWVLGFHHIAALQKEGLPISNVLIDSVVTSHIFLHGNSQ